MPNAVPLSLERKLLEETASLSYLTLCPFWTVQVQRCRRTGPSWWPVVKWWQPCLMGITWKQRVFWFQFMVFPKRLSCHSWNIYTQTLVAQVSCISVRYYLTHLSFLVTHFDKLLSLKSVLTCIRVLTSWNVLSRQRWCWYNNEFSVNSSGRAVIGYLLWAVRLWQMFTYCSRCHQHGGHCRYPGNGGVLWYPLAIPVL